MGFKKCFVYNCPNNSGNCPDKIFVYVPMKEPIRRQWCEAANVSILISNSYCCEDHFNLEEDVENFIQWKLMPGTRIRLKPGVVPRYNLPSKNQIPIYRERKRPNILRKNCELQNKNLNNISCQVYPELTGRTIPNILKRPKPKALKSSNIENMQYTFNIINDLVHVETFKSLNNFCTKNKDKELSENNANISNSKNLTIDLVLNEDSISNLETAQILEIANNLKSEPEENIRQVELKKEIEETPLEEPKFEEITIKTENFDESTTNDYILYGAYIGRRLQEIENPVLQKRIQAEINSIFDRA